LLILKRYARGVAAVILMPVVVVNLVTIAADLQARAARRRAAGRRRFPLASGAAGAALAELLLVGRYGQVVAVLQYLMLGFAAFGVGAGAGASGLAPPAHRQPGPGAGAAPDVVTGAWPCSAPR
jgi:hypothetical protein